MIVLVNSVGLIKFATALSVASSSISLGFLSHIIMENSYYFHCPLLRFTVTFFIATLLVGNVGAHPSSSSGTHNPCNFPAIFNFGDSNSDTGGYSAVFGQAWPPAGETYFGAPAGRYSDGRLIIDFIAEKLGLPHLSAYLDSIGTNFTHGANFATAASRIRKLNHSVPQGRLSPISLDIQKNEYAQFTTRTQTIRNRGGVFQNLMPRSEYFSRALYTFDIGQNDITSSYNISMTKEEVKDLTSDIFDEFSESIKGIYGLGGRYFWIHNTGPVGCLAYMLDSLQITAGQIDKIGCVKPINDIAQYFNRRLNETVVRLRKELPSSAITYVDVYKVKYLLISKAKKYGFKQPLRACCGHGGKYNYNSKYGCGAKMKVNGTEIVVGSCKNPKVKICWDGVHYTEAANKFVFDQIVDGSFSDPPISLTMACRRPTSY
ncbi:hypothetical protein MKW98_029626 [Papaver atlanticum]|uniref:Uncharacterized protein n=1 Tax=Papaver atlanticum TaxID=357466 RepID=A0AAD4XRF0_9MAGN|nr:hypothetical protein MKW98_029626 [Papaver atlanticum]